MPARKADNTKRYAETGTAGFITADPSDPAVKQRVESGSLRELSDEEAQAMDPTLREEYQDQDQADDADNK